ncbi:exocyst complex component 3-like protein 4 [Salminus brasiliensis]|uniref:exocyst complex component 3-like protein 4 n=1 Tax=Salminus brasiliensis TaxID=930266 RepID=UPI003B83A178
MEINELLKRDCLEEAYPHLLFLQLEIQREQEALGEKSPPVELINKEKDLSLLYGTLRHKVNDIIRHSCELPSKEVLGHVVIIIQEEEKREGDLRGMGGWRGAWRDAVLNGVRDTLKGVQLDSREENASWLAVHLGHLGKVIVELLEKVKTELVDSYPSNFNVFDTYVSSCHEVVGEHLKDFLGKITELRDCYSMLDFIINQYHGEKILGSPSLQPEMEKQKALTLPDDFVDQIKDKYCNWLQEDLNTSLGRIIKIEQKEVWDEKATPKTEHEKFTTSEIHIDICRVIASYAKNSGNLNADLKKRVLCGCLKVLKHFPKRFEKEFTKQSVSLLGSEPLDFCLWAKYHVAYTNSFSLLKEHMEGYRESCPDQVVELGREVDRLLLSLRQALLKQFKVEIEPFMENLMTKTWLTTDRDFKELMARIEIYSGSGKSMRPHPAQSFTNDMHYHVVKEYISQLLKNKYSCKGRKNSLAAEKIRDQWGELRRLFSDMGSTLEWLHPLGDQLSKIIEQEKEKDIQNFIEPLIENYPDISETQLSAILFFRDRSIGTYLKKNPVIQHFIEPKQNSGKKNHKHILFSDIK